ncbi:MAG: Branched-chain amino acid transporter substrate-binding protein, partial [Cryobacterium sp.]|nr:Branched-chain amino acid transporter substrate-binding protein [Cryobacterium sp.]
MKTKLTAVAATACAVVLLAAGCAVTPTDDSSSTPDALRIGWLLPQTGPISSLGAPQIAALELAAKD